MYKHTAPSITINARLLLARLLITHARFKRNRIPLPSLHDCSSSHKIPQALMINQHNHEQLSCVRIPTDTTDARLLHAYNSTYVVSTFLQTRTSDARKLRACLNWLCCSTVIDSHVQSYRTSITSLKLLANVSLSGLATFCDRPEIAHTPAPLYSMLATVSYTCLRKLLLRRYSKVSGF